MGSLKRRLRSLEEDAQDERRLRIKRCIGERIEVEMESTGATLEQAIQTVVDDQWGDLGPEARDIIASGIAGWSRLDWLVAIGRVP
jgi:hypothetical protein